MTLPKTYGNSHSFFNKRKKTNKIVQKTIVPMVFLKKVIYVSATVCPLKSQKTTIVIYVDLWE